MQPQGRTRWIQGGGTLKQRARGARVALPESAHAGDVEHPGMLGSKLAGACKRPLRLGAVARPVGAVHRLHKRADIPFSCRGWGHGLVVE